MTFATYDPTAKSGHITLSNGNCTTTSDGLSSYQNAASNLLLSAGKLQCEWTIGAPSGGSAQRYGLSQSTDSVVDGSVVGASSTSYAFETVTGLKYHNGSAVAYGTSATTADVIGMVWDTVAGTVHFYKNGTDLGQAFSGVTGTFRLQCTGYGSGANNTLNTGSTTFAHAVGGATGWSSDPIFTVSHTAPAPTFMVGDSGIIGIAPAPQGSILIPFQGVVGTAAAPTGVITGLTGNALTVAGRAPMPASLIHGAANPYTMIVGIASTPKGVISGVGGKVISIIGTAPTPTGSFDTVGVVGVAPAPTGVIAVVTGNVAAVIGSARSPIFIASLIGGNTASIVGRAIAPIMEVAGFSSVTIALVGRAPVPYGVIILSSPVLTNYRTWVLNTRKGALSEYGPEFAYNSFALFNGQVLAAGSGGLVSLGMQSDDAGAAIDASIRTGKDSFSSSFLKRVESLYVGYETDGELQLSVITSEAGVNLYTLDKGDAVGLTQRRVKVGKGIQSRYLQIDVANVAGCDFSVDDIFVKTNKLHRRLTGTKLRTITVRGRAPRPTLVAHVN